MARKKKSTQIALISDIHGNLPALEAVLEDAARHKVDEIWNLGDMLGYAPFPNEVLQKLREVGAVNLIGNYDLKVLDFKRKQEKWKRKKAPAKYAGFQWNDAQLVEGDRVFLESLPEQIRYSVCGLEALLVHGSPASTDELLNSDTPAASLQELAEMAHLLTFDESLREAVVQSERKRCERFRPERVEAELLGYVEEVCS